MAKKSISQITATNHARDFVRYLKNHYSLPIAQAYLFGSFAKKNNRTWSDIDVCVISPKFQKVDPLTYLWTKRRDIDIERGIEPYGIALADFVEINPIAAEIKKYGVEIKI